MGITASIEIKGCFKENINILDLLQVLPFKKKLLFDSQIHVGIRKGIDIDCSYIETHNKSESDIFKFVSNIADLASIYLGIEIKKEFHYFTFFFFDDSSIHFTIDGNRKKIDDRYTDFSWYYNNLIKILIGNSFQITSFEYIDQD